MRLGLPLHRRLRNDLGGAQGKVWFEKCGLAIRVSYRMRFARSIAFSVADQILVGKSKLRRTGRANSTRKHGFQ